MTFLELLGNKVEFTRYPENRLEHAFHDAYQLYSYEIEGDGYAVIGWEYLINNLALTEDELTDMITSGFLVPCAIK